ncbi:unnamed protein product [Aphanomyces euteiches]|uniref:ethanolamine kinase n=1 Tax=Aphanomyces euteiches TaxID=100861 RepID=A0A6G0XEQ9_9STRA|nr:hypothetical protein Ae201684_005336 [Aphanomyces euteiches]KAH9092583.1 hypothetical protein Ae201684P_008255 [Aphanomyces euteiches]KAH9154722.1 hypothetical protein AeRB84_003229 [Aphanomyces euteiches]
MPTGLEPFFDKIRPVHFGIVIALSTCVCIIATYQLLRPKEKKQTTSRGIKMSSQVTYLNNSKAILDYEVGGRGEDFEFDDCKHVACIIYPPFKNANHDDIKIKIICGGITNRLYRLSWQDHSVLIRLYGEHTEDYIDRDIDNATFAELSRRGFAPTYHGRFSNGRVEGWVDGAPLEPAQMGQSDILELIAKEVGKLHSMDMDFPKSPRLWQKIHVFEDLASKVSFDDPIKQDNLEKLNLNQIKQRVQWLQSILPSPKNDHGKKLLESLRGSPMAKLAAEFVQESVFSHNDILSGNILYNPSWNKVQIIDYEYGSYNYRGFDFGNHFCEHCGFDMNLNDFPPKEKQFLFYKAYLSTASPALLQSLTRDGNLDEFLVALYDAGNLYALASHLFWGLWAVVQAGSSSIEFDFLDYARMRFDALEMHLDLFCPKDI